MEFEPTSVLEVFGSSRNGLAFRGSDLDLCLTFQGHTFGSDPPGRFCNVPELINQLAQVLGRHEMMQNVIPVPDAIVPIVKFEYIFEGKGYRGDISYHKVLAQRNTALIGRYVTLDDRFQKLAFVLKAMIKDTVRNGKFLDQSRLVNFNPKSGLIHF